jgi:hypothetical protein
MRCLLRSVFLLLLVIPVGEGLAEGIPEFLPPPLSGAIRACPVTSPNGRHSPWADIPGLWDYPPGPWHHGDGFLWVHLPEGGKWLFPPGKELRDRMIWIRAFPGPLEVIGRRLDAPAPPLEVKVANPEDEKTLGTLVFWVRFPSEGCWEIIGRLSGPYGEASLRVVVLVLRLPFAPLEARWLPPELAVADEEVEGALEAVRTIYRPAQEERERLWWARWGPRTTKGFWVEVPVFSWGYGALVVETARRGWQGGPPNPIGPVERLLIRGQPARCIQSPQEDATALLWEEGNFRYRVLQWGLRLGCADLRRVVEGAPTPSPGGKP